MTVIDELERREFEGYIRASIKELEEKLSLLILK